MYRVACWIVLVGISICSLGWVYSQDSQGQSPEATADGSSPYGDLLEQRAKLFLSLQKAKLNQLESLNRRIPNSVPLADINNLKLNVELGEKLMEAVTDDSIEARKSAYLILAKNAVSAAEDELGRAEQVSQQMKGRVSDEDLEVLKLKASLARVNFEIGQKAVETSTEDELRWKIDLLYDEVLKLRNELKQARRNR